uniref:RecQ-mediated genome instability protein 1 n=1 Tax=Parastrongyloides trichosuri TaxID=131310 RepID=A0A0N4ZP24_PARTI
MDTIYGDLLRFFFKNHINVNKKWLKDAVDFLKLEFNICRFEVMTNYLFHQILYSDLSDSMEKRNHIKDESNVIKEEEINLFVQIKTIYDISVSVLNQYMDMTFQDVTIGDFKLIDDESAKNESKSNSYGKSRRMLLLTLTDGENDFEAVEYEYIPFLSPFLRPGTKMFIFGKCLTTNNIIQLKKSNCQLFGGEVSGYVDKYRLDLILPPLLKDYKPTERDTKQALKYVCKKIKENDILLGNFFDISSHDNSAPMDHNVNNFEEENIKVFDTLNLITENLTIKKSKIQNSIDDLFQRSLDFNVENTVINNSKNDNLTEKKLKIQNLTDDVFNRSLNLNVESTTTNNFRRDNLTIKKPEIQSSINNFLNKPPDLKVENIVTNNSKQENLTVKKPKIQSSFDNLSETSPDFIIEDTTTSNCAFSEVKIDNMITCDDVYGYFFNHQICLNYEWVKEVMNKSKFYEPDGYLEIFTEFLNGDIKDMCGISMQVLREGNQIVQAPVIMEVNCVSKIRKDSPLLKNIKLTKRFLYEISDGEKCFQAVEEEMIKCNNDCFIPGNKLKIHKRLEMLNGILLLNTENCRLLDENYITSSMNNTSKSNRRSADCSLDYSLPHKKPKIE